MKSIFESKTFWVNLISGIATFLEGEKFINIIPPEAEPYVLAAVFGLNIILRYITVSEIKPIMDTKISNMKVEMIALFLVPTLLLSACATNPGPKGSPERQVALYGIQAGKYLAEVQTTADNLFAQKVLPEAAYRQVLRGLVKANAEGERLGAALKAYDAAITDAERSNIVAQIDAALVTLQAALPGVVPEGLPVDVASRIGKGIIEVQRLMLTIARFTAPTGAYLRQTAPGEWSINQLRFAN